MNSVDFHLIECQWIDTSKEDVVSNDLLFVEQTLHIENKCSSVEMDYISNNWFPNNSTVDNNNHIYTLQTNSLVLLFLFSSCLARTQWSKTIGQRMNLCLNCRIDDTTQLQTNSQIYFKRCQRNQIQRKKRNKRRANNSSPLFSFFSVKSVSFLLFLNKVKWLKTILQLQLKTKFKNNSPKNSINPKKHRSIKIQLTNVSSEMEIILNCSFSSSSSSLSFANLFC